VRRVLGVVATGTLVAALGFSAARAAVASDLSSPAESSDDRLDLGSQLMLRLFGETSDSSASFAAAHGDRASESPLRGLALQIAPVAAKPYLDDNFAVGFEQNRLTLEDLAAGDTSGFSPTRPNLQSFGVRFAPQDSLLSSNALFMAAYQPVAPAPNISPAPGTIAFAPPVTSSVDGLQEQTQTASALTPNLHVGPVRFEGAANADRAATQTSQSSLSDRSYDAGANFDVHAAKRTLTFDLTSEYEQVAPGESSGVSAAPLNSSSLQIPGAPLFISDYANLNRLSLGAGLSVPVVHGLTLNLNYDAQRLYGGYGLPGLMNLDSVNNSYGGKLTFNIPKTSSFLSISAYQDRFGDTVFPLNESTQTREDVNFTVKF
jgi:hypothetical protein